MPNDPRFLPIAAQAGATPAQAGAAPRPGRAQVPAQGGRPCTCTDGTKIACRVAS
jgi:hypothetical protein